ncbi:class F sortase [Dermatophilaceae bacterium Sec6.4]
MNEQRRLRSRSIGIGLLCACLVLAGAVAIVWGLHRPPHNGPIALPTSTATTASTVPETSNGGTPNSTPAPTSATTTPAVAPSLPTKVDIPSITEGSPLLRLGTTTAGEIAVPTDKLADDAGWYTGSPMPGADGPAVIVGHSTSSRGAAVFYKLAQVKVGAEVRVTTKNGKVLVFTVYKVASYPKTNFPTNTVYANTTGPELRVVTCGGTFDTQTGHLRNNTVVYAKLTA